MNSWSIVWKHFHEVSTRRKIFSELVRHSSQRERWKIIFVLFLFLIFVFGAFFHERSLLVMLGLVVSECYFLWLLDFLKDRIFLEEYGDPMDSSAPPDTEDHRQTRYFIFKDGLNKEFINKSHVCDCFELIDSKLDMENSRGLIVKKYSGFVAGFIAGLLLSVAKSVEVVFVVKSVFWIVLFSFLVIPIISMVPSRIERLKEMKYFMQLYCREVD